MEREDTLNWATGDVGAEIMLYLRLSHSLDVASRFAGRIDTTRAARLASTLAPLAGSYLTIWREYTREWNVTRRRVANAAADSLLLLISGSSPQRDSTARTGARSTAQDVIAVLGDFDSYVGRPRPPRAARDTAMADLVALALRHDGPTHDVSRQRAPPRGWGVRTCRSHAA